MKPRVYCSLALALILSNPVQAQSDFAHRIALTGKIWGYLKYHHTGVCDTDWDRALLDNLDGQSEFDSNATFNEHIAMLISWAGRNEAPNVEPSDIQDIDLIPSAKAWMQDSILSDPNRLALQEIEDAFRPFQNCFVMRSDVGGPSFETDDQFYNQTELGWAERLLAMFRFWNILNYYSPYLALIDEDWEQVLDSYVTRMLKISGHDEFHLLMAEFTAEADDSHGFMLSPVISDLLGDNWMPFALELIEGKNIVTRAKQEIEIRVGDEILSIDGQDVNERRDELGRYFAASNPAAKAYVISQFLLRAPRTSAIIGYRQGGVVRNATVTMNSPNVDFLAAIDGPAWFRQDMESCQLGYVNLGLLQPDQVQMAMNRLGSTDGIVFDARYYPRGTVWDLVNELYLGPIDIAQFRVPRIDYPGATESVMGRIGQGTPSPYGGRLMILIDEGTASQGEYTVMGLEQHPGAVKIGSQTRASDGNVSRIYLPGGISVSMTALGVYYPDGTPTQRIGLVPDLYVVPTIQGIRDGVDQVLQEAMNCEHVLDPEWPAEIVPASAVYYDPSHDGHGFDLSRVGERHILVNYTYRPDGTPVWYLATGSAEAGVFRLDEGSYSSYTYDFGSNSATQHPVAQAKFTLDFKAGQQQIECAIANPSSREFPASLDWRQQEDATRWCPQKQRFGPTERLREIEGLWYAGEEDRGWGLTVRMQGRTLFVVLYFYERSGRPSWAIATGQVSEEWPMDGPVALDLIGMRGYCFSCEPHPIEERIIGRIELSLAEATRDVAEDNWVSVEALPPTDGQPWLRNHVPLVLLSDPH